MSLIDFTTDPATGVAPIAIEGIVTRAPASTRPAARRAAVVRRRAGVRAVPVDAERQRVYPVVGQRVLVLISDQQAAWAFPAWQS
jgi:hypothetical protein